MRTTVTLDADVELTIKEEMKAGKTFKAALNDLVRRARYVPRNESKKAKPFKIRAFDMGVFPHLNYDKTSELLAMLDEEDYK